MLPKLQSKPSGADLFRSELDQILDPEHELETRKNQIILARRSAR